MKRLLFWTPRILCLVFAMFVSSFALDVFGEGRGFWRTAAALMIHLAPAGIVLAALAVAWRWAWVGAILFFGLGAWYLIGFWGRFHWSAYACISGSLFVIGFLFLLDWLSGPVQRTRA